MKNKNRMTGRKFEEAVRKDLEENGWIVDRWTNNVEFPKNNIKKKPADRTGKLIPAKYFKWNRYTGFPDFIAYRSVYAEKGNSFEIIAVEVKTNGYLTPEERDKCQWLLESNTFQNIFIAQKADNGEVEYAQFKND